ncbi:hypothetical protein RchiOBHm_Chr2g0105381 [Rosa chinensis]|uniref:Uncharacterized protein n=1 Tax=Rosa chinensis TaxID=74649 RepID=A0A2P6RNG2_ROSCH|nr:hypothetical protein RchiOBHm_Chr2g0105381 [Rosa chinensis]
MRSNKAKVDPAFDLSGGTLHLIEVWQSKPLDSQHCFRFGAFGLKVQNKYRSCGVKNSRVLDF